MENLIKKAQKGDEEAFIQALTSYMPVMYKVARTRLSSEEDIGDAVQETILSSFKNLQSLNLDSRHLITRQAGQPLNPHKVPSVSQEPRQRAILDRDSQSIQ